MFTLQVPWFELILRAGLVYAIVLVGLRLTGKRQIGQLTPFDFVLLLLISNAVQNAMTGPDTSFLGGVIVVGTLLILNTIVTRLTQSSIKLNHLIQGEPTMLILQGKVLTEHLKKESVTTEELLEALREHGIETIDEVNLAVLEVDGSISVIRREDMKPEHQNPKRLRALKRHRD